MAATPDAGCDESSVTRAALWRQRVLEAETGMANYLAWERAGRDTSQWLQVQQSVHAETGAIEEDDEEAWKRFFFRAQALLEEFVIGLAGFAGMDGWIAATSSVHSAVERGTGRGSADIMERFARQGELYGSQYEVTIARRAHSALEVTHCAIWDYRESARRRGVKITLDSPCQYCARATRANASARGFVAEVTLHSFTDGRGCSWSWTEPGSDLSTELPTLDEPRRADTCPPS